VIIGPSQHGKTTFLREIFGVTEGLHAAIGDGTESVTRRPHIWNCSSTFVPVEIQFIDTPGIFDSEISNENTKASIMKFLRDNNPHCILLFHKFASETTAMFNHSLEFANQIATEYRAPIIFVHTCCDVELNSYPREFVAQVRRANPEIEARRTGKDPEMRKAAIQELAMRCFAEWKAIRERKVCERLDSSITIASTCSIFNDLSDGTLPDGTIAKNELLKTICTVAGDSLLVMAVEHLERERFWAKTLSLLGAAAVVGVALILGARR
jgi:hypothetical protein